MDANAVRDVFDVAVVGFGPSGATAAGLLGGHGLRTFVCDRSTEVYDKPRAIALDHEILRVFQQLGVVDRVLAHVEPFTPSEYYGVDGTLIKRLTMMAEPYPLGYVPSNVFTQPPVEAILREHARALPDVTTALGTAVVGVEQDDELVTLSLRDAGGDTHTVRARYVIACDGASSFVRETVGLALQDLEFDEPWLVVDVRVNEQGLAKLPKTSVQFCDPERPATLVIGPGNHRRWEISLKEGEDPRLAATPEETWKLLARWITPADGELWRQASYRFHALVAQDWRRGRVFLAGDAAHQQPPFLGQGMCQGVRDVANLAWKLAAVLRGESGDALLDSYGVERKRHVIDLTTTIKSIGAVICERDPAKARARDAALLAQCGGQVRDQPRQDVLPRLSEGCLAADDTARGQLFPQPRVVGGDGAPVLLDALVGAGWRLVVDATLAGVAAGEVQAVVIGEGGLQELDGVVRAWFARHGCHAALVRPDHYVFGVARDAAGVDGLLGQWRQVLAH